jgi:transcriptional regulator with XRE-family HTH domain
MKKRGVLYDTLELAERIKKRAEFRKISVHKLLTAAGLGRNFIHSLLKSGSMPKADNLAKIADYLECSVDYLLGRTDEPTVNSGIIRDSGASERESTE